MIDLSRQQWHGLLAAAIAAGAWVAPAAAQTVGTFSWQTQPYCNVLTVSVTQVGGTYRLEGFDDQCGAAVRGSVIGTGFLNPDGTIGLGFNVVAGPGGGPVHIDATVTLPSVAGTWRDSAGRSGAFTFAPAVPAAGSPRPAGGIGLAAIDTAVVQRRLQNGCPSGQAIGLVNQDGTVVCIPAGGDVTGVTAGAGLSGGGPSGNVVLNIDFAGSGSANLAARSDHTHASGDNTRVGPRSIVVVAPAPGTANTGLGAEAMNAISGSNNTGLGADAISPCTGLPVCNVVVGDGNTAVGVAALRDVRGSFNTAIGLTTLDADGMTGSSNTALGWNALTALTTGNANLALGRSAGSAVTTGSDNILLANGGVAAESGAIRIGSTPHTDAYIRGIEGAAVSGASDVPVLIDSSHKLGTITSSRRFKEDIQALAIDGRRLQALRPVAFRYRASEGRGTARQFGLVAEEVAEVFPELVVLDADGQPFTVRYHQLPPLLLAEVQRLEQERMSHAARLDALERELAVLRATSDARVRR